MNHIVEGARVVLVLSGGQDSTTVGFMLRERRCYIHAITFDYGQRHSREIRAAANVAMLMGVESHEVVNMRGLLRGTSPLVNAGSELEQYRDYNSLPGGLEKTFVPMRNQLMLTVAANRAHVLGTRHVAIGVCLGDEEGYPDCRLPFLRAFEEVSSLGTFTGQDGAPMALNLYAPLLNYTKAATVDEAVRLRGCYAALAHTHTGYDGQFPPTGRDHATLLRAKGFREAGWPDPLVLRAVDAGLMEMPADDNYSPERVQRARAMLNA